MVQWTMLLLFHFSYFQYMYILNISHNLQTFIKSDTAILTKAPLPEGTFFSR